MVLLLMMLMILVMIRRRMKVRRKRVKFGVFRFLFLEVSVKTFRKLIFNIFFFGTRIILSSVLEEFPSIIFFSFFSYWSVSLTTEK